MFNNTFTIKTQTENNNNQKIILYIPINNKNAKIEMSADDWLNISDKVARTLKNPHLEKIKENPKRFLSNDALKSFSPKFLELTNNLLKAVGDAPYHNQFIYSNFKSLEGIGILGAILEQHGFQEYKLKKTQAGYIEDPDDNAGIYSEGI